jgi:hypothetical protein
MMIPFVLSTSRGDGTERCDQDKHTARMREVKKQRLTKNSQIRFGRSNSDGKQKREKGEFQMTVRHVLAKSGSVYIPNVRFRSRFH